MPRRSRVDWPLLVDDDVLDAGLLFVASAEDAASESDVVHVSVSAFDNGCFVST
jgi:hypothetical protein